MFHKRFEAFNDIINLFLFCADAEQIAHPGGPSKPRTRSQQSPAKSSSRSPLRNATQDSNVRKTSSVDFKEPLVADRYFSYSQALSKTPLATLSELLRANMDGTHSSAPESAEVRYLNDQPALEVLKNQERTFRAEFRNSKESSPLASNPGSSRQGESTPSSSPGSASQRLENLRRHQPDDKLEKLKERIRRQRQHLEEAAEREKLQGRLEQPIVTSVGNNMPTAKVRKVAVAPPAPIYKGFNNVETKIRTPDGKVLKEEEFHNLSREIYRDLSRQLAGNVFIHREQKREKSRDRKSPKPVRKVHRLGSDSVSKFCFFFVVISPASWREGQKLVKMVLGPVPKGPREEAPSSSADRRSGTGEAEEPWNHDPSLHGCKPLTTHFISFFSQTDTNIFTLISPVTQEETLDGTPLCGNTSLLSPDIQGILDDLQLDCKASEKEQRARKSSRANPCPRTSRSASPVTRRPDSTSITDRGHKKRHYDADAVRQYIARQQEERKKRQAAQKRAQMEEAERKNQRLKALYEKQREVAKTLSAEASVAPVQKRLQETYTKLMLEEAQLGEEASQDDGSTQMGLERMPMYQPSGESDKENKRLEALQSPSSSDKSLNDLPPPRLFRNDLEAGVSTFPQPHPLNAAVQRVTGPDSHAPAASNEHLLSQLLRLEAAVAASNMKHTTPPAAAASSTKSPSKMSRIEALKATAASLSSRIESEARKLAGQGINYGATTSLDVDAMLAPGASNVEFRGWKGTVPYSSENPASPRTQRILSSPGHRSYSDNVLPGVGNLHDFRENKEITRNGLTNVHRRSPDIPTNVHDSSAGSISEGPLLSEGSFSDEEMFPPRHPSRNVPKPDYLKAADHYAGQKRGNQRLLEFQREAAMSSALSPPQRESSNAHWEELNKGSPLSVINIFTRNLQGWNVEPKSPHASPLHSDNGRGSPAVYEEDFVSSQSSKASDQMKRGSNLSRSVIRRRETHLCSDHWGAFKPQKRALGGFYFVLMFYVWAFCRSSYSGSTNSSSQLGLDSSNEAAERGRLPANHSKLGPSVSNGKTELANPTFISYQGYWLFVCFSSNPFRLMHCVSLLGDLQYSPAVLQQRMAAELQYLESMQNSILQLADVERLMGVSMAQQESASLAQMLKVKQQRHERELYELKIKAEREALEAKLQLEENRQQVARVKSESLAASQKEALGGLQESTSKMMSQQAEAAQHTADAARNIKEVSRDFYPLPVSSFDSTLGFLSLQETNIRQKTTFLYKAKSTSPPTGVLVFQMTELAPTSSSSRRSSSRHREATKTETGRRMTAGADRDDAANSSIEENIPGATNDSLCSGSIPSAGDERADSTSVATEYSLKFDEPMTEDEIEERSFRSVLPSESHRRGTIEKKSHHLDESEDDGGIPEGGSEQNVHITFSGGQDSFSQFTMDMVHQYMKDEEVRLQHQSSLLHLRQKALKEKTKTELAWLELQKKRLRDKGEDDKMPPIRKKQRGLLMKLQQEQAEIKRLQEANRAARKERQLLLKQQQEIERMRNSTLRLKERLKCAEWKDSEAASSNVSLAADARSPSPSHSVSGSETSSIMQKLKKMRSHTDEKFLTKREQQLMQRRHHAEELLQWKQRLDQEEAEVRRMEKEALAVWEQKRLLEKDLKKLEVEEEEIPETASQPDSPQSPEPQTDVHKGEAEESFTLSEAATYMLPPYFPIDNISDQSDIESRIKGLKEELRKQKLTAFQLKKEQKKRHIERLKAEEASLLKQLETYNNFIEKTKAELSKESDSTPESLQIKDSNSNLEASSAKPPSSREMVTALRQCRKTCLWRNEQPLLSSLTGLQRQRGSSLRNRPLIQPTKRNETSEQVSTVSASVQHPSSADDLKPVSVTFSKRSESLKDAEASSRADGYHHDFESAGTSAREDLGSKPDSSSGIQGSSKDSRNDSLDSVGEEEIFEELSQHPLESEDSHSSGRLLDIYQGKHGPSQETKSVNSSHAPPISPQQTPAVSAGDEMPSFNIGDRVLVGGVQPGTLRFKGPTSFANGFWAGVELEQPEGSNNGTYDGVVYFECKDRHGIFAPPDKITHFPNKFEPYNDATEDEDSFSGDFSNEGDQKNKTSADSSERPGHPKSENAPSVCEDAGCENKKKRSHLTSPHTDEADIILDFQDPSHPLIVSDVDEAEQIKEADCKTRNLFENKDVSQTGIKNHQQVSRDQQGKQAVDTFADELLKDFLERTVEQFSEIKKVKEQKIIASNQMHDDNKEEGKRTVEQKDGLPFFLPAEQEELSSPELWNKSVSHPVLGASGQEELAKRLAELELSRELLGDQGDDQDWFDEDFGLSSRRKQILKEKEEGKTPLLPPPPKLPEQPAMVVPHSVTEVGKMVHAATREIWEACSLGKGGALLDSQTPIPTPSLEYLSDESCKQEQEAVSIRSYKQAVFDLTWEIIQQIYAEDPVTDQPQWVKPRQFKSSSIYQVKTSGDINKIQEFVTAEILKMFGLKQDQNQKTDWQKMLKFGRKKRDRVDQILVQELQEEEAQWVNYDEDELSVKMQLADSIFDALLKDTAETFTRIFEKRPAVVSGST
uniref:Centrosomal protein 350 n=1 Tax=Oryzias latipes TaxID=8090 RepID=A0A3P9J507_ORYLA